MEAHWYLGIKCLNLYTYLYWPFQGFFQSKHQKFSAWEEEFQGKPYVNRGLNTKWEKRFDPVEVSNCPIDESMKNKATTSSVQETSTELLKDGDYNPQSDSGKYINISSVVDF